MVVRAFAYGGVHAFVHRPGFRLVSIHSGGAQGQWAPCCVMCGASKRMVHARRRGHLQQCEGVGVRSEEWLGQV